MRPASMPSTEGGGPWLLGHAGAVFRGLKAGEDLTNFVMRSADHYLFEELLP